MGYIPEICGISCNWFEAIISASVGDNKRFLLTEVHLLHVERKDLERKSLGVELILLGVSSTHSPSPAPFEFALGCSALFRALWLSLSLCHHEKLPLQLVIPDIIKLDYDRGPHYYEICLLDKIWFLSHGTFCSSWKLEIIIVRTKTVPCKDTQSANTGGKAEADSCPPLTDHTVDFLLSLDLPSVFLFRESPSFSDCIPWCSHHMSLVGCWKETRALTLSKQKFCYESLL